MIGRLMTRERYRTRTGNEHRPRRRCNCTIGDADFKTCHAFYRGDHELSSFPGRITTVLNATAIDLLLIFALCRVSGFALHTSLGLLTTTISAAN